MNNSDVRRQRILGRHGDGARSNEHFKGDVYQTTSVFTSISNTKDDLPTKALDLLKITKNKN